MQKGTTTAEAPLRKTEGAVGDTSEDDGRRGLINTERFLWYKDMVMHTGKRKSGAQVDEIKGSKGGNDSKWLFLLDIWIRMLYKDMVMGW